MEAIELELMQPGVRMITDSVLVKDKRGRPILAYFSGHPRPGQERNKDNIPVRNTPFEFGCGCD